MISVIVPVRNGASYIGRCLDSVLTNTYTDIELIVVENGSTDGTLALCRAYGQRDPRVRVLTSDTSGQSRARNLGLEAASGEWIAFADADDYVSPLLYETLLRTAQRTESDFVFCGFVQGCETDYAFPAPDGKASPCTTDAYYAGMYPDALYAYNVVWNKLIRRGVIGDTRFDETLSFAEDRGFISRCVCRAARITRIEDQLYYYWRGNRDCICLSADQYERMSLIHALGKDQTYMDTEHPDHPLWSEYVSCSLLQNGSVRLRRARENGLPDLEAQLEPIVSEARRRVKSARCLPGKVKLRFLAEHDMPGLFALVSRISGH